MGAILSQAAGPDDTPLPKNSKPKLHPLAYYSATLLPAERNYDIYERELLAVMKSLAHWRHYLGWTKFPFIILTDHANLQYWKAPKNLNQRTARWHADLQEYDFEIHYIPGKTNTGPDILSRPLNIDQGQENNRDTTILPWKGMKAWVTDYIAGCATCQQNKNLTHWPRIPLYRITTPEDSLPFQQIAMDLITGLPKIRGKDAILTVVNHGCSRAALFLPCSTTITGPGIAALYLKNIYPWFGLPKKVITDRDPRFTSHFGKGLAVKIGAQQNISTAFHPRTDGLSE